MSDAHTADTVAVPGALHSDNDAGTTRAGRIRQQEALPADAAVLIAQDTEIPLLRAPGDAWGLLVVAADYAANSGKLCLFAAVPLAEAPDAPACEGDVVVQLRVPQASMDDQHRAESVDVDVLVARHGTWQGAGSWPALDALWPHRVAPTITQIMELANDFDRCTDDTRPLSADPTDVIGPLGNMQHLMSVGALRDGELLYCSRPHNGELYEARVHRGGILFPDGRWFARPSGALTALGYKHQNGWHYWCRTRGHVRLSDLRTAHALSTTRHCRTRRPTDLAGMLATGVLQPGDELRCVRPIKGTVHTAQLLSDGQLQLDDGTRHRGPAAAIRAATAGAVTDGWNHWRRTSDNHTLAELHDTPTNTQAQ